MKKKKKKSSIRRKLQSQELKKRIEKGRRNVTGKKNSIVMGDNIPMWYPKDGDHVIDILPYLAGKNDRDTAEGSPTYTFSYEVHRNVGPANAMVMCLSEMYNKPCPICEHRQKLREDGADDDVWKALFPKKRNLYNIICYDRGEEEKGVQVWDEASFYSEKNIMAISKKRGRGGKSGKLVNFTDVDNGKSISFTIEPPVSKDDYRSYEGFTFEDREYAIEDEYLEACYTLDEIVYIPTYEEVDDMYWGSKKHGKDEDDDEEETKSKRRKRSSDEDEDDDEEESKNLDDLMGELEDCEDLEDLEEFVDENDIDYKIKKKTKFKKARREIEAMLLEQYSDDEESDEEDDEDDEDEEEEYTWPQIRNMKSKELKKLIKSEDLDVDPDDADDIKELRQMVAEELGVDDIPF